LISPPGNRLIRHAADWSGEAVVPVVDRDQPRPAAGHDRAATVETIGDSLGTAWLTEAKNPTIAMISTSKVVDMRFSPP
jgi:hypothetical protein